MSLGLLKDHLVKAQQDFAIFVIEQAIKQKLTLEETLEYLRELRRNN